MAVCDFCKVSDKAAEMTAVKIAKDGKVYVFHYHNSASRPCLLLKIKELKNHFDSQG